MNTPPKKIGTDEPLFKCPICKAFLPNTSVTSFPFCSDRCRLIDLGKWLDGSYTTSRPIDPTGNDEDIQHQH